jgi:hypothetical protein
LSGGVTPEIAVDVAAFNDATVNARTEPRSLEDFAQTLEHYAWAGDEPIDALHRHYSARFRAYLIDDDAQRWASERRRRMHRYR